MNQFDIHTLCRYSLAELRHMCVTCESCKKCPFYKKFNNSVCEIIELYTRIGINVLCADLEKFNK